MKITKKDLAEAIQTAIAQGIEEANYPENFSVEQFKALPTFAARMKYVKERLPKVAAGSARAVFIVDDSTVLKVAMNEKGKAQNDVEADIGRNTHYPVAQVFEVGDGGAWIEMERAVKATPKLFKSLSGGVDIKVLDATLRYFDNLNRGRTAWTSKPEGYDELMDNEFVMDVASLMSDYDMPSGDLGRISSWGVVNRGGQQKLVLIDFGLTNTVYKDFYAPKNTPRY